MLAIGGLIDYAVTSDGAALSGDFQLTEMTIVYACNRVPVATLTFLDGDPATGTFALSNGDKLVPGKELEIKLGYDTRRETVFKGVVVKHTRRVAAVGGSYTEVTCKDKCVKMTLGREMACFPGMKDSDVAAQLIGKHGLAADVEDFGVTHPELLQYGCSDWDFVLLRADLHGKLVVAREGKLTIAAPDLGKAAVLTLEYGANVLEFIAELDAATQLAAVTAQAWDLGGQVMAESNARAVTLAEAGNLKGSDLSKVVGPDAYALRHAGSLKTEELGDWATARLQKSRLARLRGEVTCAGTVLYPGDVIELKGLGDRFNGNVLVSGVRHELMNGNWTSHVTFGLDDDWYATQVAVNSPPAGGLMPAVAGLQVGKVKKIDEDPDSLFRIQVNLPAFGTNALVWARPAAPGAGSKRGFFCLPEVDDEVLVGFLDDDPRYPVVLGGLFSTNAAAPVAATASNDQKGFYSREGVQLTFDDKNKVLTLQTPGKNKVKLDDAGKTVTVEDGHGNKITLSQNGIVLDSAGDITLKATKNIKLTTASGNVDLSAVNITHAANAKFAASGNAGVEVKSSAIASLQGALVKIN